MLDRSSKWEFVTGWNPIVRQNPNDLWHVDLCYPKDKDGVERIVFVAVDHVSRFVIARVCKARTSEEVPLVRTSES